MHQINDYTRHMAYNYESSINPSVNSTMTSTELYNSSNYRENYSVLSPIVNTPSQNHNQHYLNSINNITSTGIYNHSSNYQNYLNPIPIASSSIVNQDPYYLNRINKIENTHTRSISSLQNYIERQDSLVPSVLSTRQIHINPNILLSNYQTPNTNQNRSVSSTSTESHSSSNQNDTDLKKKSRSLETKNKSSCNKKSSRSTGSVATLSRSARRRRQRKRSQALKVYVEKIREIDNATRKKKPKGIDARILLNAKAKLQLQISTIKNNIVDVLSAKSNSTDKGVSPIKFDEKKNSSTSKNSRYSPIRFNGFEDNKNNSSSGKDNKSSVKYKLIKTEKSTEVDDHQV